MKSWSLILTAITISSSAAFAGANWKVTQPAWTDQHEKQFGEFVARLGTAVEKRQCGTVKDCLKSSANAYYGSDPAGLRYYADCADLPYYLRTYFAWKNGLPFSYVKEVSPNPGQNAKDIRYTTLGNQVSRRVDVIPKSGFFRRSYPDAVEVLNDDVGGYTSSATFRMPGTGEQDPSLFSDFYPTKLDRNSIRPGTVIYDPNGHVAVVYKVTDEGRVFYIDAHPDNSLTSGMYTPKFVRSNPAQGAGFKNFRPLTMVDAKNDNGEYIGGKVVGTPNSQIPYYSTEQFFGNMPDSRGEWTKGVFNINNQNVNYYDYLRMKLTLGAQHLNPIEDMKNLVTDICVSLKDRVAAVDASRTSGVQLKAHPDRLPVNIYGSEGEWENYATPSRDARLKVAFIDLLNQAKANLQKYEQHDPTLSYNGGNLAADLFAAYAETAKACQFSYFTSSGQSVLMNLEAARQRLYNMSFDPYHCVELRWGARIPQEMVSCADDSTKKAWYNAEQWLRNQIDRRYDVKMDYSLGDLTGPKPGAGVDTAPDTDIVTFLKSKM